MSVHHHVRASELLRRVLYAGEQLADQYQHSTVGIGHVLLVLAMEERSLMSSHLLACGLDVALLRQGLERQDDDLLTSIGPRLDEALTWAKQADSHYTGTEHLLLALAFNPMGVLVLHRHGADVDMLRQTLETGTG
jgi:ATP-dependent Clp protease ATP-binding subunit ClpA